MAATMQCGCTYLRPRGPADGLAATQTHSEFFNVALPKSLDQTTSTSVAEAKRMGRPLGDAGAKGFGVRAGTRHLPLTIRLAAGAPKFALVSVAAC